MTTVAPSRAMVAQILFDQFRGGGRWAVQPPGSKTFRPTEAPISASDIKFYHLEDRNCLGFYFLDTNNRCQCSCLDIDNHGGENAHWRDQTEQVAIALSKMDILPVVEVSQSGAGAHVWIFFDSPIPAKTVRTFWRLFLAAKVPDHPSHEINPKQDELPQGGYGNLVRYPLWNQSHFVDVEEGWMKIEPEHVDFGCTDESHLLQLIDILDPHGTLRERTANQQLPPVVPTKAEVSPRTRSLLENAGTLLGRRWRGDTSGLNGNSGSELAQSIAVLLVMCHTPTAEISAVLEEFMRARGSEKADRPDWISRTLGKAYAFVQADEKVPGTEAPLLKTEPEWITFEGAVEKYIAKVEQGGDMVIPTGIKSLDEAIEGGLGIGEMIVLGARPSHAKTLLAVQWVEHAAGLGHKGLYISEEMSDWAIGGRRLMAISGIPKPKWEINTADILRGEAAAYYQNKAKSWIVSGVGTVDNAIATIRKGVSDHGVEVVAVDYLQLLRSAEAQGTRYEQITEVSQRLKSISLELGITLIALAQINRMIEADEDYRPHASYLKDSGQIEQDADTIIMPIHPYRFDNQRFAPEEYRIHVLKNRNRKGAGEDIDLRINLDKQEVHEC